MQRYTVTFTKVFVPGSTLAGLTYTETEHGLTEEQALHVADFCRRHTVEPVKAYCSSHYTVTGFSVTPSL